ncbi:MAG: hypothetical protein ACRD7E_00535, partial [Bryobacteraceae bacterium]
KKIPALAVCCHLIETVDISFMRRFVFVSWFMAGAAVLYAQSSTGASRATDTSRQPVAAAVQHPLIDDAQVRAWLDKWQARLSLEEWQIEARIVRAWELPQGTVANVHWSLPKKKATIRIMNSIDSNLPKSEILEDTELSVVHELVHLSMAKLPLDSKNTELEEETVKRISTALIELDMKDRGGK